MSDNTQVLRDAPTDAQKAYALEALRAIGYVSEDKYQKALKLARRFVAAYSAEAAEPPRRMAALPHNPRLTIDSALMAARAPHESEHDEDFACCQLGCIQLDEPRLVMQPNAGHMVPWVHGWTHQEFASCAAHGCQPLASPPPPRRMQPNHRVLGGHHALEHDENSDCLRYWCTAVSSPPLAQQECSNCGHGIQSPWCFCPNCAQSTTWMPSPPPPIGDRPLIGDTKLATKAMPGKETESD